MIKLFTVLTVANWTGLLVALALGQTAARQWTAPQVHALSGIVAALLCCGVHCAVFTYFIATAKWVRHACTVKGLSDAFVQPTASFKAQAFPAALLAMASAFAAALSGVMVENDGAWPLWHALLSWAALAINGVVAWVEYAAIVRNANLIDQVLAAR
jgi:hypothetical protein